MYYKGLNNIRKIFKEVTSDETVSQVLSKYRYVKKEELKHKFLFSILRYISKKAKELSLNTNYSYEDLFQTGCLVTLEVIDTYNPKSGDIENKIFAIIVYAMLEEISSNKHIISIPSQKITDYYRYQKFLEDNKDKTLSKEQKIRMVHKIYKTRLGEETFRQIDGIIRRDNQISTQSPFYNDIEIKMSSNPNVMDNLIYFEEIKMVKKILSRLKPIEREVVTAEYGGLRKIAKKYKIKNINRLTWLKDETMDKIRSKFLARAA